MEATEEAKGIFGKIVPPRLEDAGLEDCALPPDAIKAAFAKAATAVRSVISASDDEEAEGHCVNDPWPVVGDSSDTLVGITDGVDEVPGSCANEKGAGLPEVTGDEVAVRDEDERVDELVTGGPTVPEGGEKACVDGLQGLELEIGGKSKGKLGKKQSDGEGNNVDDDDSEEKDSEVPILTEDYV
ncbi:OLC1v1014785C1 [Oldenlandia corymbosa var. corymbosa]|uniref:OLC1v1014785C1 n=1 Tax=Oldenlandia corymbosa var. corymbosa TaxID=529605 RepID=A0AAV1E212_OLDCO|nr:OLC1v1014785C1 [Oldenlandia corymbosa var. corymbosa]